MDAHHPILNEPTIHVSPYTLILNIHIQEGAELSLSMGDERNESVYEVVDEIKGVPDACMESHFEYGSYVRVGEVRNDSAHRSGTDEPASC